MRTKWLGPLVAFLWIAYAFFLFRYVFYETPAGLFSNQRSVWADWTVHLTFLTHFVKSPMRQWVTDNPIFLGVSFNYPFATSLVSAGLVKMGATLTHAMVWSAQILFTILVLTTFAFYSLRLQSTEKGAAALTMLLAGGASLGFLLLFPDLGKPLREYAWLPKYGLENGSFLSVLLLPQRALHLGVPAGMIVLIALHYMPDLEPIEPRTKRIQIATGILVGLLPVVHVHTFAAIALTTAVFFFFNRDQWRSFIPFAITAGIATLVVMGYLHRSSFRSGFLIFDPGWLANPAKAKTYGWIMLWWVNWGIFLPLAMLCSFRESTRNDPFFWSGALLFVIANFVRFQPWDWDNTKIFFWAYALMVPSVTAYLASFFDSGERASKIATGFLYFTMIFVGLLELYRMGPGNQFHATVFSRDEIKLAEEFSKKLTPQDVVLVAPHHHDWVSALAGGRILMGFEGWLFSMGLNYVDRLDEIKEMYVGGKNAHDLIKKHGVTYIVYNEHVREAFKTDQKFLDKHFTRILTNPLATVYKVTAKAGTP